MRGHANKLKAMSRPKRGEMVPIGRDCQCGRQILEKYSSRNCSTKRFCSRSCGVKFRDPVKTRSAGQVCDISAMLLRTRAPDVQKKRFETLVRIGHMDRLVDLAHSDLAIEKANASRAKNPGFCSTPENFSAKHWFLRCPNGKTYAFKNLSWWIRANRDMFDPADVVFGSGGVPKCRAYGGLLSISPHRVKTNGSWKGWTWCSIDERRFNGGGDLLQRAYTGDGGGGLHPASANI